VKKGKLEDIALLLTGTVNVYDKHFTIHKNADQRREEYLHTIRYYLQHYPYPIVFVENSNEDLSGHFKEEILNKRLEILSFDGNRYAPEIGKGLGELKCIEYAITNAKTFNDDIFIFKITGRYKVLNFRNFIKSYERAPSLELLADLTNNFRNSSSAIIGFKRFFPKRYLFKNAHLINDQKGFYFEHALAKAVLEAIGDHINFQIFKYYPKLRAISGTTGQPYKKSFLYMLPRHFKYWLRYYIVIR
jgi:hypothetical protein